jgi:hypothetical protein
MKITQKQLKELIIEEYSALLHENENIVPFDDNAKDVIDSMVEERAPELREEILQEFVSSIGRYNRRIDDRNFLKNTLRVLINTFVGDIIFDYHDGIVGGATLHNLPDFSQEDFEKAHDYIEFHPNVEKVMKEINPIMEFTIKMSQIASNPNLSLKYGISRDDGEMLLDILKTDDPAYLIQAYEIMGSLT